LFQIHPDYFGNHMLQTLQILEVKYGLAPLFFFIAIVAFMFIGSWFGKWRLKKITKDKVPAIHDDFLTAIFGISALLIAFSFSIATEHFSQRQNAVLKEVRAISSAYQITQLLNATDQLKLQNSILDYLDNEITLYDDWQNLQTLNARINDQQKRLNKIKSQAIDASLDAPLRTRDLAKSNVFTSIEKMNESFGEQVSLMKVHPPALILRSLVILIAIVSFLSGYSMVIKKEHDWMLAFLFAFIMMGAIFVILNLEYPNVGSLHLNNTKTQLIELRNLLQ